MQSYKLISTTLLSHTLSLSSWDLHTLDTCACTHTEMCMFTCMSTQVPSHKLKHAHTHTDTHNCRHLGCIRLWPCALFIPVFIPVCVNCNRCVHSVTLCPIIQTSIPLLPSLHLCPAPHAHTHTLRTCVIHTHLLVHLINHTTSASSQGVIHSREVSCRQSLRWKHKHTGRTLSQNGYRCTNRFFLSTYICLYIK